MMINKYIEPIIAKKKKHDFHAWRKKRKIIKYCRSLSPSFSELCQIYDFLDKLRYSYMYANDQNFHLFMGTFPKNYHAGNCKSIVYEEDGKFSISILCFMETSEIAIEIARSCRNSKDKDTIRFVDGEYKFKDKYDEERFLFITSCIMGGVIELIEYYYKNKRF